MSIVKMVDRVVKSITPQRSRNQGAPYITYHPHGAMTFNATTGGLAAAAVQAESYPTNVTGDVFKWGEGVTLLAANAALGDCWVEGIVARDADKATNYFFVALTHELSTGAYPTYNQLECSIPIPIETAVQDMISYIRVEPPILFNNNQPINLHLASEAVGAGAATGNKMCFWAIVSRAR